MACTNMSIVKDCCGRQSRIPKMQIPEEDSNSKNFCWKHSENKNSLTDGKSTQQEPNNDDDVTKS